MAHSDGYTTLIDVQSIMRKKGIIKAWTKQIFDTPQVNHTYPYKPYSVSKNQFAANCTARTVTAFQLASQTYDTRPFVEPVPNSNGEIFLNLVCATPEPTHTKSQSF